MTGDDWSIPDWLSVSRETHDRLQVFYRLVCKWNAAINLVSAAGSEDWGAAPKQAVADRLVHRIAAHFTDRP